MKPATKNFNAANNTPWLAEIAFYDLDGVAVDLSVYTSFLMHVKTDAFDPEPQVVPTVTLVIDANHNRLQIAAPVSPDVETLWGRYVYDVIGLDGSGDPVETIMQGTIDVNQGVTVV